MSLTEAHCNKCCGMRTHNVLHTARSTWENETHEVNGSDTYDTVKCSGCGDIKLRLTAWNSEEHEDYITYFPAAIFRREPIWFSQLWSKLGKNDQFIEPLLKEIYTALQNGMPSLATMGVRALLEQVMVTKAGDKGSFAKNIAAFQELGFVSIVQRKRLEAILEAGHAAIHRTFTPEVRDVITLLDITEHIIEAVYLHEELVQQLRKRIPPRPTKPKKN